MAPPSDQHTPDPDGPPATGGAEGDQPIVRRIQSQLRDRIRTGELGPGSKLPSMRQLAGEYQCSLGIVKQAITTLAAQGFLRSSPRRGVFVADQMPAGREIAVFLPHLEIERLHLALRGIRRGLRDTDFRLTILADESPAGASTLLPASLASPQVAGVMMMLPSANEEDQLAVRLAERAVPTVVVDISNKSNGVDVVAIDPVETGRVGIRHLIERGHRVIGVVEPISDRRTPRELLAGVEEAVRASGVEITLHHAPVPRPEGGDRSGSLPPWAPARDTTESLLGAHPGITAVIGVGPQNALGAVLAARSRRLSIPDDLSILGVLGDSSALQTADPPITIVDNPLLDVCEQAARRLVSRIEGLGEKPTVISRPPVLIERSSVGPPAGDG